MNRSSIPSSPSCNWQEALRKQLDNLVKERTKLLEASHLHLSKERKATEQLLDKYADTIKQLLNNDAPIEDGMVLIGSKVELEYVEYRTMDNFVIAFPEETDPEEGVISFLSPIGSQLLLAAIGSIVSIHTPAGAMQVRIVSIKHSWNGS
ncbi:GreA/GreB family elongation factor [Paenibacillus sp. J5C_2022]|uniref:GreA/GreB family elongation factor n=1 Tax=Paenibacillus sp. J5C2022 TaxID=2977129 RepID=UPI0021D067F6|nr:GreA/GreB family elongation factor [Paenibacillus sp. J5C2022]MCU6713096.1 GreA/GreB family elongation factor [Paenibacillus sp. J5C2022]